MIRKRIPAFDLIRILAMVLIVVYHWNTYCYIRLIDTPVLLPFNIVNGNLGSIGVSLFFILSGASLMYVYRENLEIRDYLKKRFLAIYPAYWLSYALMFLFVYRIHHRKLTGEYWTWIFTFLGMDGLLNGLIPSIYLVGEWFVGCIVILYLLFPLLRKAVLKRPALTALAAVILTACAVIWDPGIPEIDHFPLFRVPEVLFGMFYVQVCFPEKEDPRARAAAKGFTAAGAAAFIGICLLRTEIPLLLTDIWLGVSSFCVLAGVFQLLPVKGRAERAAAAAAGYTYEIFLIHHVPMGDFLRYMGNETIPFEGELLRFGAYCVTIVVCAVVIENILRRFMRRLRRAEYKKSR